jgi:hypothetical protein
MNRWYLTLICSVTIATGCSTTQQIVDLWNTPDVYKLIANNTHTMYWTYCGKDEYKNVLLKRTDGEYRAPGDSLYQKLPMKWVEDHWFLVRPDAVRLPRGVQPGQQLTLKNAEFVLAERSPFQMRKTDMLQIQQPVIPSSIMPDADQTGILLPNMPDADGGK